MERFRANIAALRREPIMEPTVNSSHVDTRASSAFGIDTAGSDHYVFGSQRDLRLSMHTYFDGFYFFYAGFYDSGGP